MMEEEVSLVRQGYYLLKMNDFSNASAVFEKALGEGEDPDAYLGLLLCENSLCEESQLIDLPKPLASYLYFEKAVACAPEKAKKKLQGYKEAQTARLDDKEAKYRTLLSEMDGEKSPERRRELIGVCRELKNYKDANDLRARLEAEQTRIDEEKKRKKKIKLAIILPAAILLFTALVVGTILFALPKVDGVRYALTLNGFSAISGDEALTSAVIQDEVHGIRVTSIGNKAFKNCAKLTTVTLGKYVAKIGRAAFNGCASLERVIGSDRVKEVGENAFRNCTSLTRIVFAPDCAIDRRAFRDCLPELAVYAGDRLIERDEDDD